MPGWFTCTRRHGNDMVTHDVAGYDERGNVLVKTWHKGESSALMECQAWRNRGFTPKGNIADVFDHPVHKKIAEELMR